MGNGAENAINCTVATFCAMRCKGIIENITAIDLEAPANKNERLCLAATKGSVKNIYAFFYVPTEDKYYTGLSGGNIASAAGPFENITPNYDNYQLLSNSNYSTFFDENNILKEEYTGATLIAVENITSPVIIDKKVTLSAVRGQTGYDTVKFIQGSDESTIEDSLINNLEINNALLINVHNNKLIGDNTQINMIESTFCTIENNIINTKKDYTIILDENSMDNTIKNNELTAAQYTGDKSVQNTTENTIEDNTPEYIEEEETLIILTESNILDYATLTNNKYTLNSQKLNGKEVIINFTTTNTFQISENFTLIADYNTAAHILNGSTGYFYNITNLYAPYAEIHIGQNPNGVQNIRNSTFAIIYVDTYIQNPTTIRNNTIIDLRTAYPIFLNGKMNTIRNNYIVRYSTGTLQTGQYVVIMNRQGTFKENTPSYDQTKLIALTNDNYNTYFNSQTNTIKEEYANKILFAIENITTPVIINQNITLSAIRGIGGYSNVTFINGSDNSIIEDSFIKHITINQTNNITLNNNKLLESESQIEIINSQNNTIENNTINTNQEYTIILQNSENNNINNNQLNALERTGEESIQTVINKLELKVDTTQFSIGDKTSIKSSIYLGDEVASNITGGKVVFKVNGKTLKDANGKVIYAKLINGVATIEDYEIPNSWNKEGLTITAVYSGSSKCEALRSQETNITTTTQTPQITTDNTTTATAGSTIQLKAKVTARDNPITNGKVVFKVNGKTVKDSNGKVIYATVDSNGEVSVNYTIPETYKTGNYTITITYTSPIYGKLNTTSTLTITA